MQKEINEIKTLVRVEIELEELSTKLEKLSKFMITKAFDELPPEQRVLMNAQASIMATYKDILTMRLKKWTQH